MSTKPEMNRPLCSENSRLTVQMHFVVTGPEEYKNIQDLRIGAASIL